MQWTRIARPVTNVGHQDGRRVFWEGPKIFELCPIVSNGFQGTKKFSRGASPPCAPWLRACGLLNALYISLVNFLNQGQNEGFAAMEHTKCLSVLLSQQRFQEKTLSAVAEFRDLSLEARLKYQFLSTSVCKISPWWRSAQSSIPLA